MEPKTTRLSLYLSTFIARLESQEKMPILVEPRTKPGLVSAQKANAASHDTSPNIKASSSLPFNQLITETEGLQGAVASVFPLAEHSGTSEVSISVAGAGASPSNAPLREFSENEQFLGLNCQITRGGILGINDHHPVNRQLSPRSHTSFLRPFTVGLEEAPNNSVHKDRQMQQDQTSNPFQGGERNQAQEKVKEVDEEADEEEDEDENEESHEQDPCSHYPFCITCQTIIQRFSKREWYTTVVSTKNLLRERALEGCPLCMLYQELVTHYSSKITVPESLTTISKGLWNSGLEGTSNISSQTIGHEFEDLMYKRDTGSKLALHFRSEKYTIVLDWKYSAAEWSGPGISKFVPQRLLYPDILNLEECPHVSGQGMALAQKWLKQCAGHKSCQAYRSKFLPTRLISISPGTPPRIFLSTGSGLKHSHKYMTLSHCWGHTKFQTLLKKNIEEFEDNIDFKNLPKTFQDSILVAQRLRVKYIWIDSLCIIQDSLNDWRKESALMGKVYSNSYCNISATAALDGTEGLFFDRKMSDLRIVQLNMRKSRHEDARLCFAHDAEFFTKSIDRAPLNQRGWVLQERLLSRCNLHFGAKQVLWECCEINACEIMPDGLISGISRSSMKDTVSTMRGLKPLHIHGDRIDLWAYRKWADIIQAYTEALLTHRTDRLVAISGLATIFQDFYALHYPTRPKYLAGIWGERAHISTQLLWHAKQIRSTPTSSSNFIAPTWSWASVDGPICNVFNYSHTTVEMITPQLPYLITTLVKDSDLFGQVSSGTLSLRGKLARISYNALPTMTTGGIKLPLHGILKIEEYRPARDFSWYTGSGDSKNPINTNVWWDRLLCPGSTVADDRLFLLPIRGEPFGDENYVEGLILESTHPRSTTTSKIRSFVPPVFRRVGKWTAYNRESVERVRAGCQYLDIHAPKEEGEPDPGKEGYNVFRGKAYSISII